MTREEATEVVKALIPHLQKFQELNDKEDRALKVEISNALYRQSGIKDYTELELICEILEKLKGVCSTPTEDNERVNLPELEIIDISSITSDINSLIDSLGLNWYNVHSCLDSIAGGKIPVLVGLAGAGKTYTANLMSEIIFAFKNNLGYSFDRMFKTTISCSNTSHNDFWGSFDAVSHTCVGKFKYIWQEALVNKSNLYYVILDEVLDIYDFRKTFGESFSKISDLPDNLVVVGTGNKDVYDLSNETFSNALKDSGVVGRFDFITVNNILENYGSDEFKRFFDSIDVSSSLEEKLKNLVLHYADKYKGNKMLVPRNVVKFIKRDTLGMSDSDYLDLLKMYIRSDSNYIIKALLTDKPSTETNNNSFDELEGLWYGRE